MPQVRIHIVPDARYPFDARGIVKRFRHAAMAVEGVRHAPGAIVIDFVRRG